MLLHLTVFHLLHIILYNSKWPLLFHWYLKLNTTIQLSTHLAHCISMSHKGLFYSNTVAAELEHVLLPTTPLNQFLIPRNLYNRNELHPLLPRPQFRPL